MGFSLILRAFFSFPNECQFIECQLFWKFRIKSAAGSIKKFYRCMAKHGNIEQDDYDYLSLTVEEKMDEWQRICERHNDPSEDDPLAEFPI